ncbi:hypothetical protein HDU76_012291, partial [Blyttiomyces sp. JEL0837]
MSGIGIGFGEIGPEYAPELLAPVILSVYGQQVLMGSGSGAGSGGVSSRKVKLDIHGYNLDFIDLKEGIVLDKFFVESVRFHVVVARTKEKMVVEATVENPAEKLPSRGSTSNATIHVTSVIAGSKPVSKRITSMITIESNNRMPDGTIRVTPNAPNSLADGTVFDVAINAFKRAVINRSHELRAERMGFTAQKMVQDRLLEVKAAFERLEVLCPTKDTAKPVRPLSELIEVLARIDAFPDERDGGGGGVPVGAGAGGVVAKSGGKKKMDLTDASVPI